MERRKKPTDHPHRERRSRPRLSDIERLTERVMRERHPAAEKHHGEKHHDEKHVPDGHKHDGHKPDVHPEEKHRHPKHK